MSIVDLENSPGPDLFYDNQFRLVLETHMNWLRTHPSTRAITPENGVMYQNQYDLYGLLTDLRIPKEHHWIIMRMNNFTHPNEFDGAVDFLLLPDQGTVNNLASGFKVANKK